MQLPAASDVNMDYILDERARELITEISMLCRVPEHRLKGSKKYNMRKIRGLIIQITTNSGPGSLRLMRILMLYPESGL